jgi:hypothetical protein
MFVCVYFVFVLSSVSSCLATGPSFVQAVLPAVYKCKIKEPHKRGPRPDMGCSAIGRRRRSLTKTGLPNLSFSPLPFYTLRLSLRLCKVDSVALRSQYVGRRT